MSITASRRYGLAKGVKMKKADDDELIYAYEELKSVWKVAEIFDMCGQSVHDRLKSLGVDTSRKDKWTEEQIEHMKENYQEYADSNKLDDLAEFYGRSKQNVCRKARSLGLTCRNRSKPDHFRDGMSKRSKQWHMENEHPKGMLGKKHCDKTKEVISEKSKLIWQNKTEEQVSKWVWKSAKTRNENGTLHGMNREKASWKAAWRNIGGVEKYYRSRWEANYARYLEKLKREGKIESWEHEPKTFWFDGIKRGCVSYLPDFRVTFLDGSVEYHEVKGWMDARSKTKLKRMSKYHPDVKMVLIDSNEYRKLEKKLCMEVEGWEK